jgi:peptide/nickel transport system substrate-binding protein
MDHGHASNDGGLTRERFLRQSAALALTSSGLAALLGCGSDAANQTAAPGGKPPARPTGTLRIAVGAPPITLDPSNASTENDLPIIGAIFDTLLTFDDQYKELVPSLAESWEANAEATEFTFNLRSGAKFHDGEPVDASAIRKTFEFYASGEGTLLSALVPKFETIDDSDPTRIRLVTRTSAPDLVRNAAFFRIISPRNVQEGASEVSRRPVGSGPYRFVRAGGQGVVLEAAEDYWGAGPYFQRVEWPVIREATSQVNALLAGQVGLVERVPPQQVQRVRSDRRRARTVEAPKAWVVTYLVFASNKPPIDDARVRQAIAYGVDRQAIVKAVLLGQGNVHDSVLPEGVYGYRRPTTVYNHDPARARELLREAGYGDGDVRIRLAANTASVNSNLITQAAAAQLEKVGIATDVDVIGDLALFQRDLARDVPQHHIFNLNHLFLTGGPLQVAFGILTSNAKYKGSDVTSAVEKMNEIPDGPEREEVIAEVQELNAQKVLYFPIAQLDLTDGVESLLRGYVPPKDGLIPHLAPVFRATDS